MEFESIQNDKCFAGYPEESIADGHQRLGLEDAAEEIIGRNFWYFSVANPPPASYLDVRESAEDD